MKINFLHKKKDTFSLKKGNINPNTYWMAVFYFGFLVTLLVCFFGFIMFTKVNTDSPNSNSTRTPSSRIITKEKINHALDFFSKRVNTSNNILNSPSGVVDPSV